MGLLRNTSVATKQNMTYREREEGREGTTVGGGEGDREVGGVRVRGGINIGSERKGEKGRGKEGKGSLGRK